MSAARIAPLGLALAVAAFGLLLPASASAYRTSKTDTGADLHWPDSAFPLRWTFSSAGSVDVGPDATLAAWTNALNTWQNVDCAFVTWQLAGTSTAADAQGGDGVTYAVFYEDRWFQGADGALAITTPVFSVNDGEIGDADTIFNGAIYQWAVNGSASRTDLESVAAHEFGHALGLDHPCELGGGGGAPDCCEYVQGGCQPKAEYYGATMFPATGPGETGERTLAEDDIAGICFLYDSGRPHTPPPTGGLGAACGTAEDCTSEICVGLPDGSGVCSELCDGTCSQPGFTCEPLQGGGGACLADPNRQPFGSACTADDQCVGNRCVANPSGGRFCSQDCGSCPTGYVCGDGVCQVDQGTPVDGGPGPTMGANQGEPCTSSSSCLPGLACVSDGTRQYCTTPCGEAGECGGGFQCVSGVCIFTQPTGGDLGAVCTAPSDCLTGQCINDGTAQYCSQGCTLPTDCPTGYNCATVGAAGLCALIPGGPGNPLNPMPPPAGGCSSTGSPPGPAQTLFGLLLLVTLMGIPILARRRR